MFFLSTTEPSLVVTLVLSHGSNNNAGVAILFSKNINVNILTVKEIEKGRILLSKVELFYLFFCFC